MNYKQLLEYIKGIKTDNLKQLNVIVISNIVIGQYFNPYMIKKFHEIDYYTCISIFTNEEIMLNDNITKLSDADVVIVWLNFEGLFPQLYNDIISEVKDKTEIVNDGIKLIEFIYTNVRKFSSGQVIWMGFEDYYEYTNQFVGNVLSEYNIVDEFNAYFKDIINDKSSIAIDLKRLIALNGIKNVYDIKGKYRWRCPYSQIFIQFVVEEIFKQYIISKNISKKCIVLDCDNVLWGGVISEDGVDNIRLGGIGIGRFYQDFQRNILTLYNLGVIIAICSKNDMNDVLNVFKNHSGMILNESNISCFQVNWNNKVENIKQIADILNIGIDSMVFVDDSIHEIESVNSVLPDVTTILFKIDTIFCDLKYFNLSIRANRTDIKKRHNTYVTNQSRKLLESRCKSYEEYLVELDTKVIILEAKKIDFNRIVELSQRTNKFTNGKRYTISEIKTLMDKGDYKLYTVEASDKFSDLGVVGAMGLIINDNEATLDLFCISCRALGRNIEELMLMYIRNIYYIVKFNFTCTEKNMGTLELLKSNIK